MLENFTISHIKGYQYDIKDSTDLTVPESTNMETDKFATRHARHPIHSHLPSTPFSIYINRVYIHININKLIKEIFFETVREYPYNQNVIRIN